METTHINQLTWNLRCASVAERDELLAYAAACGIACAPPVSADDLGLAWNERQGKLYLFPAEWAGQAEAGRTYELLSADQFRALVDAYASEQAPCEVTMLVAAPAASLTDEQFRQQAFTQAKQAGTQYLACTSITHTPAFTRGPGGDAIGELAYYNVQIWDLTEASVARHHGEFCFVAQGETPAACLTTLAHKLAELAGAQEERELRELEADPTRQNNRHLASDLALALAA